MRIFLAATSLASHYGGPAVSVSRFALALSHAGIDVGLWTQDGSVAATDLLPNEPLKRLSRLTGSLRSVIERFVPDIVHDNGLWLPQNHQLAGLASRLKLARVVSTRGMLEPWARRHKKLKKDIAWLFYQQHDLTRADLIHATSEVEARNVSLLNLDVPVVTIPNGIDIPELPMDAVSHAAGGQRTALYVGRLYPVKGLPLLIQAWDRVRPRGWRLVIVGPDEAGHRAELEKMVMAADLAGNIYFAGPLTGAAKSQALSGADLFVLPTHSESFGMAVGEAMAHGLPVLTTEAAPWPALVEKGCGWRTGISVTALAEGLRSATGLDRPALRAMGAIGRGHVAELGWDMVASRFIATYDSILAR